MSDWIRGGKALVSLIPAVSDCGGSHATCRRGNGEGVPAAKKLVGTKSIDQPASRKDLVNHFPTDGCCCVTIHPKSFLGPFTPSSDIHGPWGLVVSYASRTTMDYPKQTPHNGAPIQNKIHPATKTLPLSVLPRPLTIP